MAVGTSSRAQTVYPIPWWTGPDVGVGDFGIMPYTDADGNTYQPFRTSDSASFSNLRAQAWFGAEDLWGVNNGGVLQSHTAFRQNTGGNPALYVEGDQVSIALVFVSPTDATVSVGGALFFDETNVNAGGQVLIRADVFVYDTSGSRIKNVSGSWNLPPGTDAAWDLGAEPELQNFSLLAGQRLYIGARKVGTAGELEVDLGNITITTDADPIPFTPVAIDDAVRIAFESQDGINYDVQYSTDLISGQWSKLPTVLLGTGGSLFFYDEAGSDVRKGYRLVEATP